MLIDKYVQWRTEKEPGVYDSLRESLISARMGMTVHSYMKYVWFCSIFCGILSGVFGLIAGFIIFNTGFKFAIYDVFNLGLSVGNSFLFEVIGTILIIAIFFGIGFVFTYSLAMQYPSMQKSSRATKINLTLHNAVSYMYAMRRGGAELLVIFKSLSENADVYGEVALEFRQVVRDTQYFGFDQITALKNLSYSTPSTKFKTFIDDLVSVSGSGGNIASYLETRVRMYQEEARFEQKQFLSVLQLVAETYVTVFVAGPLFLIVIMVVMGMVGKSAVLQLSVISYMVLPICAIVFMIFVDLISIKEEGVERYMRVTEMNEFSDVIVTPSDKDESHLFAILDTYDKKRAFVQFIRHPIEWFMMDATRSFAVTVPIAAIYVLAVILYTPRYVDIEVIFAVIDDHIVIAILMIIIPYSILIELWRRKIRRLESGTPDFLDRLAGVNRVGITIAGAIGVLVRANLGVISTEVRRIKRDLDWGANVNDALIRFEKRINTSSIARTVTLITKASDMSGDIGQVLAIASSDARMNEVLKNERTSEMIIYTIIIYVSFLVFMFVVAVLDANFLSVLEEQVGGTSAAVTGTGASASFMQISSMPVDTFRRLLYHTCLVQAFFSGLIAGLMGEGSVKAGVKHSVIMLLVALFIFNLFI